MGIPFYNSPYFFTYAHLINIILAVLLMVGVYIFNLQHLKQRHAQIICHETANTQQNGIEFKKLITGATIIMLVIVFLMLISTMERRVVSNIVICFTITLVNLYYVKSVKVVNHARHVLNQKKVYFVNLKIAFKTFCTKLDVRSTRTIFPVNE